MRLAEPNDRLSPGMTGELAFIMDAKDKAIAIPSAGGAGRRRCTAFADGRIVKVAAKIGLSSVERVEVVSGLAPGDRVVISPVGDLPEGKPSARKYIDPTTAAGLNKPAAGQSFKGFK